MDEQALLQQISDLLQQYLSLGSGTPVEAEAQNLLDSIQANSGGQPDAGAVPPPAADAGGMPPPDATGQDPLGMGVGPGEPPANPDAKTYDQANVSALERLKKRNAAG